MVTSKTDKSPEVPEVLYHYTDASGLKGIFETGNLWATDTLYLNDASESDYALSLLTPLLMDWMPQEDPDEEPVVAGLVDAAISKHREAISGSSYTCIASFCEEEDLLSQWRGYTGPTVGYAVGFRTNDLVQAGRLILEKVLYDVESQMEFLRQMVRTAVQQHGRTHGKPALLRFLEAEECYGLVLNVAVKASHIKHPSFVAEAEWRARKLVVSPGGMSFRSTQLGITPYVEIDISNPIDDLPMVESVVVGPCPEPLLARRAVQSLMLKVGFDPSDIQITNSEIPLRS